MDAVVSKRTLGKLYSAFAKKVAKMKNHEVYGQNPNCEKWNCLIKDNLILEVLSQYKRKCVTTQSEECYIGESINTVQTELGNKTYIEASADYGINTSASMFLIGATNNFSDITQLQIDNTNFFNGVPSPGSAAYLAPIVVGSIIDIWVADALGGVVVGPKAGNGKYLVTNVSGPTTTTESGTVICMVYDVTFISGNSNYSTQNNVTSADTGYAQDDLRDYIGITYSNVIPGFEAKTIFQFNEPEGTQNVLASDFDGITDLTSLSFDCGEYEFPTTGLFIGDLVYWDGDTNEYTLTPTEFFIGFTIKDSLGVEIELDVACDINICVDTTSTTEVFNDNKELTQEDIDCLICKI